ncbi:MAG: cytochrome c [Verrucomicrobia bacterium]|nr:cytochrome c [Verrucomicrobiota bacterium]
MSLKPSVLPRLEASHHEKIFALAVVAAGLGAAELRITLPPETATLKPGPGAERANSICLTCHSADYVSTQPRLSRAAWTAGVQKMKAKYGAPIQDNQVDPLVEYLVRNYGTEPAKKP